jgi:hypothetical protein
MLLVLFFLFVFIKSISTQSHLYGPGLRASFQVPVRYFYLESRDAEGQKYVKMSFQYFPFKKTPYLD